jgi:hypothetical protein
LFPLLLPFDWMFHHIVERGADRMVVFVGQQSVTDTALVMGLHGLYLCRVLYAILSIGVIAIARGSYYWEDFAYTRSLLVKSCSPLMLYYCIFQGNRKMLHVCV